MNWQEYFLNIAEAVKLKSKDQRTQIGAVIVGKDNEIVSTGFNSFPRGIKDNVEERQQRPEKYYWAEHAERNSIYHCARNGIATEGTTLYTQGLPCSDCTRAIIQSGIAEIVLHKEWEHGISFNVNREKWNESGQRSDIMIYESGIKVRVVGAKLGVKAMLDGKIYEL